MSSQNEEKVVLKSGKATKVFSILALVFSAIGYVFVETTSILELLVSILITIINLVFNNNTSILVSLSLNLGFQGIVAITRLCLLIPCVVGFVFSIVSLILNRNTKDKISVAFSSASLIFSIISIFSILKYFLYWLALVILVIIVILATFVVIKFALLSLLIG